MVGQLTSVLRKHRRKLIKLKKQTKGNRKYNPDAVYEFIVVYKGEHDGVPPTVREICDNLGISSTSVTNYILRRLQRDGRIQLVPDRSRNIMVVGGQWLPPEAI